MTKNLNKRIELKREINISKVPSKRELADKSKKYLVNVKNLRRIFEKELNKALLALTEKESLMLYRWALTFTKINPKLHSQIQYAS